MKPGPELDALIAEKVMGWTHEMRRPPSATPEEGVWVSPEKLYWDKHGSLPAFSTDVAAAWEVVEKMNHDGWIMRLESYDTECSCEFSKALPDKIVRHRVDCISSAPLAICLTALKAMEVIYD